jgi:hypothetical protein
MALAAAGMMTLVAVGVALVALARMSARAQV